MKAFLLLLALPLIARAQENAADLSKVSPADATGWDERQILETAEARIQQFRTGPAEIRVRDRDGQPLANTAVRVRLVRHEFKLGCNAFPLGPVLKRGLDPAARQVYGERFASLLNYATLPFYWAYYEPEPGQTNEADVRQMAAWCREHGIRGEGTPARVARNVSRLGQGAARCRGAAAPNGADHRPRPPFQRDDRYFRRHQ